MSDQNDSRGGGHPATTERARDTDSFEWIEEHPRPSRGATIALVVLVCVAGGGVGGFFGRLAGSGYHRLTPYLAGAADGRFVHPIGWTALRTGSSVMEIRRACERFGLAIGVIVGLMAAMLWCRLMFWIARRNRNTHLITHGTWVGLVVGVLAALMLHAVFWIALASVSTYALTVGLFDAFLSGPPTGALCGLLCWLVLKPTPPAEQGRQATSA